MPISRENRSRYLRKMKTKQNFCPIYHRAARNERDMEGLLGGIDGLVKRYQSGYPDDERRAWIEQRLRAWWQGRGEG